MLKKIGIIGCGNMGEAIFSRLSRVLDKSTALMVSEQDAARRDYIQSKYKVIVEIDNDTVVKYSDVIVVAVKPKDFEDLLKGEVCCGINEKKLLISIAAGITTKHIESVIGSEMPVVRAMPNMGATIGEAMTALSRGSSALDDHMKTAVEIFSLIGDVVEVDEETMDAVTAISGSGPAYFFYMMEALIKAAKSLGLDDDVASRLVLKTALASAKLPGAMKEGPAALRERVASKGGTTEEALAVLKKNKFEDIVRDAVKAAHRRSREISKG